VAAERNMELPTETDRRRRKFFCHRGAVIRHKRVYMRVVMP
jgi:hypothetical protein